MLLEQWKVQVTTVQIDFSELLGLSQDQDLNQVIDEGTLAPKSQVINLIWEPETNINCLLIN